MQYCNVKLLVTLFSLSSLSSAVTTNLSFPPFAPTGGETILTNSSGTPQGGITWGFLVDTDGDGFDGLELLGTTVDLSTDGFFGASDDFFIAADQTTIGPDNLVFSEGTATVISYNLLDPLTSSPVAGGETYGLFFTDGTTLTTSDSFGFFEAQTLSSADNPNEGLIPTDNSVTNNVTQFRTGSPLTQDFTFGVPVPEPTSSALLGLGALCLITQRRRN